MYEYPKGKHAMSHKYCCEIQPGFLISDRLAKIFSVSGSLLSGESDIIIQTSGGLHNPSDVNCVKFITIPRTIWRKIPIFAVLPSGDVHI